MLNASAFLVGEDGSVFAADGFAEAFDQSLCLLRITQVTAANEETERVGFAKQGELVVRKRRVRKTDKKGEGVEDIQRLRDWNYLEGRRSMPW